MINLFELIIDLNYIEWIAALLGVFAVYFGVKQRIYCWPFGLVNAMLYAIIFYQAQLYSSMCLQAVYMSLQVYGWYHWLHGKNPDHSVPVNDLTGRQRLVWLGVAVIGSVGLGTGMQLYTSAQLAYVDATATSLSLVGQWLMARKVVESWAFWIVVNVISIGLYFSQGLWVTSLLYGVFLGLAIMGLLSWRRDLKAQQSI